MQKGTKRYTKAEIEFIKNNYQSLTVAEIALQLGRSPKGVRSKMEHMMLTLNTLERNIPYQWTDDKIEFLKSNYLNLSDEKMSKILNISASSICRKRIELGLRIHHGNEYIQAGYAMQYINGKKVWVHKHNAEIKYGRKILKSEKVHHINGDKLDNRPENLYVCEDRSFHDKVHWSLRKIAFELVKQGVIKFNENTGEYYL